MNERSSLYRREHHKEAMVWQDRGRQDRQTEDEDEDRQTDAELKHMVRKHRYTKTHLCTLVLIADSDSTSRIIFRCKYRKFHLHSLAPV